MFCLPWSTCRLIIICGIVTTSVNTLFVKDLQFRLLSDAVEVTFTLQSDVTFSQTQRVRIVVEKNTFLHVYFQLSTNQKSLRRSGKKRAVVVACSLSPIGLCHFTTSCRRMVTLVESRTGHKLKLWREADFPFCLLAQHTQHTCSLRRKGF